jgi:phosphate transport system substrate-binding protein
MIRSFFLFLVATFVSGMAIAAPIKFTGSDLMLGQVDVEMQRFAKANDLEISFELKGSRLGLEALQAKQADLGLLVFGADAIKPGPEFTSLVVGYLTTVIAVPQTLPLSQVTYDQMAAIFGAREQNDARRWADVGVVGNQAQRSILPVAAGRRAGLALDIFRYTVLTKPDLKPEVALFDDAVAAAARITSEEGGMALLPAAPLAEGKLKVLLLAKGPRDVAYGPTAENLHSGDYPLRLPIYLVFRKGDAQRLGFAIRHLLSDETVPVLNAAGVTPLPTQARNQVLFDLESM